MFHSKNHTTNVRVPKPDPRQSAETTKLQSDAIKFAAQREAAEHEASVEGEIARTKCELEQQSQHLDALVEKETKLRQRLAEMSSGLLALLQGLVSMGSAAVVTAAEFFLVTTTIGPLLRLSSEESQTVAFSVVATSGLVKVAVAFVMRGSFFGQYRRWAQYLLLIFPVCALGVYAAAMSGEARADVLELYSDIEAQVDVQNAQLFVTALATLLPLMSGILFAYGVSAVQHALDKISLTVQLTTCVASRLRVEGSLPSLAGALAELEGKLSALAEYAKERENLALAELQKQLIKEAPPPSAAEPELTPRQVVKKLLAQRYAKVLAARQAN